jgi:hypothetical protein
MVSLFMFSPEALDKRRWRASRTRPSRHSRHARTSQM